MQLLKASTGDSNHLLKNPYKITTLDSASSYSLQQKAPQESKACSNQIKFIVILLIEQQNEKAFLTDKQGWIHVTSNQMTPSLKLLQMSFHESRQEIEFISVSPVINLRKSFLISFRLAFIFFSLDRMRLKTYQIVLDILIRRVKVCWY